MNMTRFKLPWSALVRLLPCPARTTQYCKTLPPQPMTILMTRILLSPRFVAGERQRLAANLAVIAASNVGANYTLIGSLAAVMWIKLLKVGCWAAGVRLRVGVRPRVIFRVGVRVRLSFGSGSGSCDPHHAAYLLS